MERFNEVWANIMAKFQEVIDIIFAIIGGLGDLAGGDESEEG